MGDLSQNVEGTAASGTEECKQSIQLLKETKELADITNEAAGAADPEASKGAEAAKGSSGGAPKDIETVFENVGMEKTISSVAPLEAMPDPPHEISNTIQSAESGRMNKLRDHSSNIFPAGIMGCKEEAIISPRRFLDAQEASKDSIGHIENMPRKMPSASKSDHNRNPLTGLGLGASDEIKKAANKRSDGNPVLGVGYDKKISNSTTRIPPGGFSHGLW
ncbi:PREDICTED: uncharacterized protein LOC108562416 [Nicrophorus vespilloides]|uniref:Uncharacterized protein LOC108562416 n=1 Tax=Nicrophorus vespilloides TaxID=110193 RepID=A0ABM1MNS8_NICVS|nr:PREDICTED: uncharacterized protein LOC108562416 [Nicrophorus vespilloides]